MAKCEGCDVSGKSVADLTQSDGKNGCQCHCFRKLLFLLLQTKTQFQSFQTETATFPNVCIFWLFKGNTETQPSKLLTYCIILTRATSKCGWIKRLVWERWQLASQVDDSSRLQLIMKHIWGQIAWSSLDLQWNRMITMLIIYFCVTAFSAGFEHWCAVLLDRGKCSSWSKTEFVSRHFIIGYNSKTQMLFVVPKAIAIPRRVLGL